MGKGGAKELPGEATLAHGQVLVVENNVEK
jgi:hypothetical protein